MRIRHALAGLLVLLASSTSAATRHAAECIDGMAEGHACHNVDLLGHLDLGELGATAGSGNGNDMWGWTDPLTGKEYALVGLDNGTAFVDISDPENPVRLGNLPTHSVSNLWRDLKVYDNHAFIVSEAADHGMQVFDLTRLRGVVSPPVTFTEDAWYGEFGRAHNIAIDEDSGYAYAVGSRQGIQQCNAGLHMIDIHDPSNPTFAGCFGDDGYTHDVQCIVYDGPDGNYLGHEICFAANEDTLTIVDVSNKVAPVMLSRRDYPGSGYTHQGWLTADRRHFLLDDEMDEIENGHNTYTYVWDVQDLTDPQPLFHYTGPLPSSDHNLYIHNGYAFESDYKSGLRILSLADIDSGLSEAAYFDTFPPSDSNGFDGTWSNYPFYASGVVAVSDISGGLFVLQPNLCVAPAPADGLTALAAGKHRIDLAWNASATAGATYAVDRTLGGCEGSATETIVTGLSQPNFSDTGASGQVTYGYRVRAFAPSGQCAAVPSTCVEAATTGTCTAPPAFAGIVSAQSAATVTCAVNLGWQPAQSYCGAGTSYNVYRSNDPDFVPALRNLLTGDITALSHDDTSAAPATDYTYVVRAADTGNGSEEGNTVRLTTRATGPDEDGDWFSGAEVGDPILAGDASSDTRTFGDPAPRHVAWEIVDDVAHGGSRSYYSGYNNQECLALGTVPITLTAGDAAALDFWTRYGIEQGWDAGVVQISDDDGGSWTTIIPAGGYPGTIANTGNACDLPIGSGAYTGTHLDWVHPEFDLSAWAGRSIRLRWLFGTDTSQTGEGWWIDDIDVAHAQVPGQCIAAADAVFSDGFDGL
ncbi:MAG TPA: choice-of-anchor B family protein [Rhodanobacteraceae bacterium]|nr:choice-of-anchor B family protein [Rhodanobacteraceae bacterium]